MTAVRSRSSTGECWGWAGGTQEAHYCGQQLAHMGTSRHTSPPGAQSLGSLQDEPSDSEAHGQEGRGHLLTTRLDEVRHRRAEGFDSASPGRSVPPKWQNSRDACSPSTLAHPWSLLMAQVFSAGATAFTAQLGGWRALAVQGLVSLEAQELHPNPGSRGAPSSYSQLLLSRACGPAVALGILQTHMPG